MEPVYASYEYNSKTEKYDYSLNGKKISEKEYLEYQNKSLEKFKQQKRGKRDLVVPGVISSDDRSWTAWMTAEEISELTKNYKELVIDDYVESKPEASVASILSTIQLSTLGHDNNYKGNGIGVYVMEPHCRDTSIPIKTLSKYTNKCTGSTDTHHSKVVNVVQYAAPLAHIFGFRSSSPHPPRPFSYSPPLEIGTHSYGSNASDAFYDVHDANMDNYIYENKVINFKSAGNDKNIPVTSPGKAMNVITVGAVNPATNRYADYYSNGSPWWSSSWKNPLLRNNYSMFYNEINKGGDKPEIAMYTDIDMGIYSSYSVFNGTSAAAPLAAGFTASLLEQHPFFKRQPALMKAVLLTGETISIPYASSWDTDNSNEGLNASVAARGITTYSSVAWRTRSAWWRGGNSAFFGSSGNTIMFTEDNIQAHKRYRISIAWLVNGGFVYQFGRLPQNLDLYVAQNGQVIAYSASTTNPFEIVDFVTSSNAPLTVFIIRNSNHGGDVLLGYHLRENF